MESVDIAAVSDDVLAKYKASGKLKGPWAGMLLGLLEKILPDLIQMIVDSLHNVVPTPTPAPK